VPLNLTKVAFGISSLAELHAVVARRSEGGTVHLTTRYRPKRAEEMIGGSLFWIIKHQLVARGPLIGFEDAEGGRTNIILEARAIPVLPVPRRAHQGWRYLAEADMPPDLDVALGGAELPPEMLAELAEVGLT
jgi:hypothetical protein